MDNILINHQVFYVEKTEGINISINLSEEINSVYEYKINIHLDSGKSPSPIHIYWKEKMVNQIGTWAPLSYRDTSINQWFHPNHNSSRFYNGSPVMSSFGPKGENSLTVALSDSIKPIEIKISVDDLHEKDEITYDVILLNGQVDLFTEYEVFMRIDKRNVPYYDAIYDAGLWSDKFVNNPVKVPYVSEMPLYSSWYNFHQFPTQDLLTKELTLASKYGFKTMILDDGWQFSGPTQGSYSECGDWLVSKEKFPDFKKFVDDVHSVGIKILVWFTVPFAGIKTKQFEKYKNENKILYVNEGCKAGILDIRFKDVRDHIKKIYRDFVNEYGIDGLKLDFIDSFQLTPSSRPYCPEMDCETIEKAVKVLLDDIYTEQALINPNFMCEFRQCYIGKEIINRCNMIRVLDCAYDAVTNRIELVALRLLNSHTAIHSDMLLWGKEETPVNCAHQLLNIMFSVPQISVLLTKIPKEQLDVLDTFLKYWQNNVDVLLHGHLRALNPESNYSLISSENETKRISVLHSRRDIVLCGKGEDIFNNTCDDGIFVESSYDYHFKIYDHFGNVLEFGEKCAGVSKLNVPSTGHCEIAK